METIPRLETERLRLRAIFPEDRQGVFELFSDPEVVRFYDFPPLERVEEADEMIRRIIRWFQNGQAIRWGMFDRADERLLGTCCLDTLHPAYRSANLGFNLRFDHWGQGLAREAVSAMLGHCFEHGLQGPLNRVQALTVPENKQSQYLLARLGFEREGVMRQAGYWKGQYHDLQLFGLLRSDWPATTDKPAGT